MFSNDCDNLNIRYHCFANITDHMISVLQMQLKGIVFCNHPHVYFRDAAKLWEHANLSILVLGVAGENSLSKIKDIFHYPKAKK